MEATAGRLGRPNPGDPSQEAENLRVPEPRGLRRAAQGPRLGSTLLILCEAP